MTEPPHYDVFLSYSGKDRDWVGAFTESLQDSGVKNWFDVSSLAPGERWQDRIQEALRDSKFLIVIVSEESMDSPWTFFELGAAVADRKRIIPVITSDIKIERLPSLLRPYQFLRESSPSVAGKRVAEVIKEGRRLET
jgi:hypothetical protein